MRQHMHACERLERYEIYAIHMHMHIIMHSAIAAGYWLADDSDRRWIAAIALNIADEYPAYTNYGISPHSILPGLNLNALPPRPFSPLCPGGSSV